MVELDFLTQRISAGYVSGPTSTLLVSKSILDLVSLRKLIPRIMGCTNHDKTIACVGHILLSEIIPTRTVPSMVKVSSVAPMR